MKSVLFICHEASRTGAPFVLLNFLKWLKYHTDIPFQILIGRDGELTQDFQELAPVEIWQKEMSNAPKYSLAALTQQIQAKEVYKDYTNRLFLQNLAKKYQNSNLGLIYANTFANGILLNALSSLNCPVISHIHELSWSMKLVSRKSRDFTEQYTHQYLVASQAVARHLIDNHQIPKQKVKVIYEFIPQANHSVTNSTSIRQEMEQRFKISPETLLVGATGTIDWRKGTDLFIHLARLVSQRYHSKPVHFLWLGGRHDYQYLKQLRYDINKLGLENIINFIGKKNNPLDYISLFDVFTLMSREDPFPLVCLEAAILEKPIVCFENAGGIPELVENDCGFIVPYLDLEMMANKVIELLDSPEKRQAMGQKGKQKVQENYSLDVVAPQILEIIKSYLN